MRRILLVVGIAFAALTAATLAVTAAAPAGGPPRYLDAHAPGVRGTSPLLSGRATSTHCRSQICGLMRLRMFDPAALPELRQHFLRSGFSVADDGEGLVIRRPDQTNAEQERREIALHLQVWQTMHPEARVEIAR